MAFSLDGLVGDGLIGILYETGSGGHHAMKPPREAEMASNEAPPEAFARLALNYPDHR